VAIALTIPTTTIGAYLKPRYVPVSDWFREESGIVEDSATAIDNSYEFHGLKI
jgi:hypothetical protein